MTGRIFPPWVLATAEFVVAGKPRERVRRRVFAWGSGVFQTAILSADLVLSMQGGGTAGHNYFDLSIAAHTSGVVP